MLHPRSRAADENAAHGITHRIHQTSTLWPRTVDYACRRPRSDINGTCAEKGGTVRYLYGSAVQICVCVQQPGGGCTCSTRGVYPTQQHRTWFGARVAPCRVSWRPKPAATARAVRSGSSPHVVPQPHGAGHEDVANRPLLDCMCDGRQTRQQRHLDAARPDRQSCASLERVMRRTDAASQ